MKQATAPLTASHARMGNAPAYFWGSGLVRTLFRTSFAAPLNSTSLAASTFLFPTCASTTFKIACSRVSACLRRHIKAASLAMATLSSICAAAAFDSLSAMSFGICGPRPRLYFEAIAG